MKNKNLIAVIVYDIAQLLLLGMLVFRIFFMGEEGTSGFTEVHFNTVLGFLIMILSVLGIYMNRRIFEVVKREKEYEIQQVNLKNIYELNQLQRSQRHDFLNHLHVIHNLIEMDEFEHLESYIEKIYKEVHDINVKIHTGLLEIDALLQAKMNMANAKGITLELNNNTNLERIKVQPWKLVSILGNLIDNAMDACMERQKEDRRVVIDLEETKFKYYFRVSNWGPEIPMNIIEKIFESGFTTKGERGQGLGLSICKRYVEEAGGKVKVVSENGTTTFSVEVNKF